MKFFQFVAKCMKCMWACETGAVLKLWSMFVERLLFTFCKFHCYGYTVSHSATMFLVVFQYLHVHPPCYPSILHPPGLPPPNITFPYYTHIIIGGTWGDWGQSHIPCNPNRLGDLRCLQAFYQPRCQGSWDKMLPCPLLRRRRPQSKVHRPLRTHQTWGLHCHVQRATTG